jgi:hypothetical protein
LRWNAMIAKMNEEYKERNAKWLST